MGRDAARRLPDDGGFLDEHSALRGFPGSLLLPPRDLGWPAEVVWGVVVASAAFLMVRAYALVPREGDERSEAQIRHGWPEFRRFVTA